jgi:hypothetical protein
MSLVQLLGWKLPRGGGEVGWVLEPESSPEFQILVFYADKFGKNNFNMGVLKNLDQAKCIQSDKAKSI